MEENRSYTFGKKEKLTSKILIEKVFKEGETFRCNKLAVKYLIGNFDIPASYQVLISIPKKNIRTAVKRNLMKRRIREAYRLHKHEIINLLAIHNKNMLICIIFIPKFIVEYREIEKNIIQITEDIKSLLNR